jgi:hypothetical protein
MALKREVSTDSTERIAPWTGFFSTGAGERLVIGDGKDRGTEQPTRRSGSIQKVSIKTVFLFLSVIMLKFQVSHPTAR